ncbi:MAG: hypothetical protein HC824_03810 [Synechococcales cyanobacterium RM1_1_8]|nr:hypothetical protein [Synechococcales cyanobacterium RM1_1_8]
MAELQDLDEQRSTMEKADNNSGHWANPRKDLPPSILSSMLSPARADNRDPFAIPLLFFPSSMAEAMAAFPQHQAIVKSRQKAIR